MHPTDRTPVTIGVPARVLVAPDSFKGTADAATVARCLATGWRRRRPGDTVIEVPLADGGEGTLDALLAAVPEAGEVLTDAPVPDPLGMPVPGRWVRLGGRGIVELAETSGLGRVDSPTPATAGRASTDGVGAVIGHARASGVESVVVAVGGSASTDGGLGLLRALGLIARDAAGHPVTGGGADLARIERLDPTGLRRPDGPVLVLTDVTAPLFGPAGAAQVFGAQKGADARTVATLDAGLRHWARLWQSLGVDPALAEAPGAGAAGGVGYGLAAALGAELTSGAAWLSRITGVDDLLAGVDVLITGEGRFDTQSMSGKVVGHLLGRTTPARRFVVAGEVDLEPDPAVTTVALARLAGSSVASRADPGRWLIRAGGQLASEFRPG